MIVTHRNITRREKTRRRFRHWYKEASPTARMLHFSTCDGCVGCTGVLDEISSYPEEGDQVDR